MNLNWFNAFLVFATAGLATLLFVPPVARLAVSLGAVDRPNSRKLQERPIPRLGGVAIVCGIAVGLAAGLLFDRGYWLRVMPAGDMVIFAGAALIVFAVGVVDDLRGVSVSRKFLFELLAASIVVGLGWKVDSMRLPGAGEVELGMLGPVLSVIWIVGVTNAINLLDGLDGLANGTVAIVSGSLMLFAVLQGNPNTLIVSGAVAGACLGFFRYNWAPAKIYMGDSGALTLGFMLGSSSLYWSMKAPAAVAILVPILALGLPVLDTLLVMAVRFVGHPGDPLRDRFAGMFRADRSHLHHLALALAPKRAQIVVALYGLVAAFCLMALLVAIRGDMWLGIGLLAVQALAVAAIRWAGMRAEARRQALSDRAQARKILARMGPLKAVPDAEEIPGGNGKPSAETGADPA